MMLDKKDPRLLFTFNYLHSSLQLQEDQWLQFVESDCGQSILEDFVKSQSPGVYYFSLNSRATLSVSKNFPFNATNKVRFIVSNSLENENRSNLDLYCGDMHIDLLNGVSAYFRTVIYLSVIFRRFYYQHCWNVRNN